MRVHTHSHIHSRGYHRKIIWIWTLHKAKLNKLISILKIQFFKRVNKAFQFHFRLPVIALSGIGFERCEMSEMKQSHEIACHNKRKKLKWQNEMRIVIILLTYLIFTNLLVLLANISSLRWQKERLWRLWNAFSKWIVMINIEKLKSIINSKMHIKQSEMRKIKFFIHFSFISFSVTFKEREKKIGIFVYGRHFFFTFFI